MNSISVSQFLDDLTVGLRFFLNTVQSFFTDVVFTKPLLYVPLILFLLLGVLGFVGWLIMESAQYSGGSSFASPYKFFANPNRQYETKMPLWTSFGLSWFRKRDNAKREKEKVQDALDRIEIQSAIYRQNKAKADEYFRNNPNSFKINIDGTSFWREDWEKQHWGYKNKSAYSKLGYSRADDEPSYDLDEALKKATL